MALIVRRGSPNFPGAVTHDLRRPSPAMATETIRSARAAHLFQQGPRSVRERDDLILVTSDRVSIYDVVLPTPIPDKGKILTQLSLCWFGQLAVIVPNHVISASDVPPEWAGRAIRCRRLEMI